MRRCIYLAEKSLSLGGTPFASLIAKGNKIIAEADGIRQAKDVTEHPEIGVLRKLQSKFKTINPRLCTIYSNCEPCAMCSFIIRELKLGRVIFGVYSPIMGGYSRWDILQDIGLETLKNFYSKPPEVIGGMLLDEAEKVFRKQAKLLKLN